MSMGKPARQSFETGAAVLLLSAAAVKLIGAVFKIPLSNLLGDAGFGRFSTAYDLFTPFYALAMTGLPVASARLYASLEAAGRAADSARLRRVTSRLFTAAGLCAAVLFLALIPALAPLTGGGTAAVYSLLAVAPSILFFFLISIRRGWYEGMHNMTPTALSDFVEALGKLLLGLGFAGLVMRSTGDAALAAAAALFGITLGVIAAWGSLALYARRRGEERARPSAADPAADRAAGRALLRAALPAAVTAVLLSVPASLIDALTVRPCLSAISSGFAQNASALYGVRGRAFTLFNLIPAVTTSVGVGAVPALSAAHAAGDRALLREKTASLFKLSLSVSLPAGMGLAVLSGGIMRLLYSAADSSALGDRLLAIYGIAAVFAGVSVPMIQALQAVGRQRAALGILLCASAVKLGANLLLVPMPRIHIFGAAISTLLLYLAVFVPALLVLLRTVGGVEAGVFVKPLAAALMSSAAAGAVSLAGGGKLLTLLATLAAVLVFAAALLVLRVFSAAEIAAFPGGKRLVSLLKRTRFLA